jgi:SPW repeat-containing protein
MLAERWWFWVLAATAAVAIVATEPRWRRATAALRAAAYRRRLVEAEPGMAVDPGPGGRWSEPSLPGLAVGLWICASPWIWGYDDVDGAIATDLVTGGLIAIVTLAGVLFPALLALNLLAGLWLAIAPWLVGYGRDDGAVGLSDTVAGLVTCVLALRGMTAATSRIRAAQPGPIGRIPGRRRS